MRYVHANEERLDYQGLITSWQRVLLQNTRVDIQ